MNKVALNVLIAMTLCVMTALTFEGIYALAQWDKPRGSIIYQTYARFVGNKEITPWNDETQASDSSEPQEPPYTRLLPREEIDRLLPKLKAAAVGLGNSPYIELKQEAAAITSRDERGCVTQKANLRKTLTHLRSNLFNPLDPLSIFFDSDRELDPEIKRLVDIYGLRPVTLTTNEYGERITVPSAKSSHKVIVAGDSVALGAMVDDSETISSQLQNLDAARQYINLGISGVRAYDVICALNKAGQRYKGQIEELIYVYCENDFHQKKSYGRPKPRQSYGRPEEVIAWLTDFVKAQGITKVTVVYAPFIYNVVPQITRFPGDKAWNRPTRASERAALAALVRKAGFRYIDIADIALAEANKAKTQFAALSIFSDLVHLSPYGTTRLVEELRRN